MGFSLKRQCLALFFLACRHLGGYNHISSEEFQNTDAGVIMKRQSILVLATVVIVLCHSAAADIWTTPVPVSEINTEYDEGAPFLSYDGLTLYFSRQGVPGPYPGRLYSATRPAPHGQFTSEQELSNLSSPGNIINYSWVSEDNLRLYYYQTPHVIKMTERIATNDPWQAGVGVPELNGLGGVVNPSLSADELTIVFTGTSVPGGLGGYDIWMGTRPDRNSPFGDFRNLLEINSTQWDFHPRLSCDGLALYFASRRNGYSQLFRATRSNADSPFGSVERLSIFDSLGGALEYPAVSGDGSTLYFCSNRPGESGGWDLWQAPIEPVVDFNGDGVVDCADMCIMVDHWGENYPLCDIGPTPFGDGIVDVQDLIVLAEHLFEEFPPVEPEEVRVNENDADSQVELEQGQILVITLESNPTTGYRWEQVESQEPILEQMGEAEFKPYETGEPPLVGAGGWEIFRFKTISAGQMTLQLVYHRPWEEGVEPLKTFSIQVVVR